MPATAEQIVLLESKVAYQDKLLLDLNDVVVEQGRVIKELNRRLAAVELFLRAATESQPPGEKPPHY